MVFMSLVDAPNHEALYLQGTRQVTSALSPQPFLQSHTWDKITHSQLFADRSIRRSFRISTSLRRTTREKGKPNQHKKAKRASPTRIDLKIELL